MGMFDFLKKKGPQGGHGEAYDDVQREAMEGGEVKRAAVGERVTSGKVRAAKSGQQGGSQEPQGEQK